MSIEELFRGTNYDIPAGQARLAEVARQEGIPIKEQRTMTYNGKRAQMLGKWAESLGKGDEFHHAAFHAMFVDTLNIGKDDVLLELASSVGLDLKEARSVLEQESFMEQVDRDWQYCRELGVTSIPTFVNGKKGISGAQPYEALKQLVEESDKGSSPFGMLRSG